jgi:hypothetical protein
MNALMQQPDPAQTDKFWDGEAQAANSNLSPYEYHNPADERLANSNGRSMASVMPQGTWGAHGTIIRRAGEGGAPLGHDPHSVATRVNVDPDIPGQSFVYDPSQIPKEAMAQAIAEAGAGQAMSVPDRRLKAANTFRLFATANQADPMPNSANRPETREAPIDMPGAYVVPKATEGGGQEPMPDPATIQPAAPPMNLTTARPAEPVQSAPGAQAAITAASFQPVPQPQQPQQLQPKVVQPATFTAAVPQQPVPQQQSVAPQQPVTEPPESLFAQPNNNMTPVAPAEAPGHAPTVQVRFEVEGMPMQQEAYFHKVTREGASLVLVYDTRAVGYPKTFPQMSDKDLAVHIIGSNSIYVTQTTGIKFPLDHYEVCVLLIKNELPVAGQSAQ